MSSLALDGSPISLLDVASIARTSRRALLTDEARARVEASRAVVEACLGDGESHYGVNTGFGSLSRTRIGRADLAALQRNLIRSHAAGVGPPLPDETVRGMLLVLAASLARGLSGVRPLVIDRILAVLGAGIAPCIPEVGSVGASGDLAPLAHAALAMMGEGRVRVAGREVGAGEALRAAGIEPLSLEAKEGLALINGTHLMCASSALLVLDAESLAADAIIACAMSVEACRGTDAHLDPRPHGARRQPGPARVAAGLRVLLQGSEIIASHREGDPRVQDPYSLRCAPQVIGACLDAIAHVRGCIERELGAVTDNPLIFREGDRAGEILSGGNFHGLPLALPLDHLALALAHIAGIAERRVFFLLSAVDPQNPLNPYLASHPGVNSGLMIAQYTAAACCNELITLCSPASVANIPTSAGIEDYNSFGPRACAKARRGIDLLRRVVAIELICAAQGMEYQRPLRSGAGVEFAHAIVRSVVPVLGDDRPPSDDIERLAEALRNGLLTELHSSASAPS